MLFSQHQSQSNEKSLVQFDYEKAVSNYLGTQSTFKGKPAYDATYSIDAILVVHDTDCILRNIYF